VISLSETSGHLLIIWPYTPEIFNVHFLILFVLRVQKQISCEHIFNHSAVNVEISALSSICVRRQGGQNCLG
jgi:hypothetical protein